MFMKKIISLVLCFIFGIFILSGCSNSSEPFEEKNYTSDTQINEINIDVRDREIEVSLSEDEQVHIKYYENSKEYYEFLVSDENVLTMTSASDKDWTDYIGGKSSAEDRKISLQIPDALLENITLSTTNENITLSALTVIRSINLSSIQSEIKKGESNLPDNKDGGEKTLNVSCNNGDVDIEFVNE